MHESLRFFERPYTKNAVVPNCFFVFLFSVAVQNVIRSSMKRPTERLDGGSWELSTQTKLPFLKANKARQRPWKKATEADEGSLTIVGENCTLHSPRHRVKGVL